MAYNRRTATFLNMILNKLYQMTHKDEFLAPKIGNQRQFDQEQIYAGVNNQQPSYNNHKQEGAHQ